MLDQKKSDWKHENKDRQKDRCLLFIFKTKANPINT